ncbi:protein disabled isoform X2 [Anoplophora glabripennis]|uniref:protein disabled isoform X2 n=1 Tax=Anoplophora glabripennis TaxID=217634 RepID=UPI00087524F1|nr:protein disabled isoform X2 [Anoplophora glabripennis]
MQTLRKKTSPLKYKNETTRFLGDGVSFKAKLIGILEVSEARGDRMCQEALSDLKMAIRAAGEHKQRITINIAIDGLRLRDEKTGDSLYHHPVHKISFIAQDMTDSRAFGYIFGSPDTGHRFFGIKTDKAASQVVIAMRDLFQVVFALKKKEIELAKQHLEKTCYPTSPLFSDSSSSSSKSVPHVSIKSAAENKTGGAASDPKNSGTAVADLVDLELELNSLQQGLNQMERITPSDPFGSKDDPFGDSFISYPSKPILPPPPSSGRERSSRTSDSSSLFSPKTPHTASSADHDKKKDFSFSHEFNSSHEEPSSGDWFTPLEGNSIFEESPLPIQEPTKDEKHEQTKQEILSQFDVFTELDPLELKNPPKKVLNDLVAQTTQEQPLFNPNFSQVTPRPAAPAGGATVFTADPFGEDPFVKEDPFADSDFSRQDPFETEFANFSTTQNNFDKLKLDANKDNLHSLLQSNLSKSPKSSMLEKQMSLAAPSPKTVQFNKQNTFDIPFDKFDEKKFSTLSQSRDNPSLDISSESECAPEPPPRPAATLMQIKPPPLPPKKQVNELTVKPPPRPPYHTEESPYDYMEKYETAPNSMEYIKNLERSPPLPVPARKSKFESDFTSAPERPKKQFNIHSAEDDYLTPISFPEKNVDVLLPPPQRSAKKQSLQVTVSSFLDTKPNITTKSANDSLTPLEGLDITLSQLTLTGLNELAQKLNIPASQLSNMTLVQLTNFLSNFIKSNSAVPVSTKSEVGNYNTDNDFPSFQADFAANFNNLNNTNSDTAYDRYAVFRELMQEEIKQTKIDSEPEEILEEKEKLENNVNSNVKLDLKPLKEEPSNNTVDRYAALREIEIEMKQSELEKDDHQYQNEIEDIAEEEEEEEEEEENTNGENTKEMEDINMINKENKFSEEKEKEIISPIKSDLIEYSKPLDNKDVKVINPVKSPLKSPVQVPAVKSPVPSAITEIVQSNTRLTSGSLSDVISGSSPEVDNTASNSDVGKKLTDATGESWAIFDQATVPSESIKEKQTVQSEEGISPWSSDSKEFGNGSPPDWRSKDSGSGTEQWSKRRRDQEGWWDTSAEPEVHYYPTNRRSTDSYDEEYYECYERPRRRRQGNWQHGGQATGGHSSSSRDVSPWEEEPRRREPRDARETRAGYRHPRGPSFERHRERRHTDSWDEDDDYEYDEEHGARFHWSERHGGRETDRESRHSTGSRDHDGDRWGEDWNEDRRHRRRRDARERWCCPDWEQGEHDKAARYAGSRRPNPELPPPGKWRDRKHDDRYYSRESQESPWEDEYSNDAEDSPRYLSAKRNWKQRPSSASETDRKTGELKPRHYLGTGGSDGERDRRYKSARRSRSRDSQYSEPSHRFKADPGPPGRLPHRSKPHLHSKPPDGDFVEVPSKKLIDSKLESNKKSSTLSRKKTKDSPKAEENLASTFPRKATVRGESLFENDFVTSEESPVANPRLGPKFNYENDFETSEAESPTVNRTVRGIRQQSLYEKNPLPLDRDFKRAASLKDSKTSPRYQPKSKLLFEDDFSPSEKSEQVPEDNSISSIKEEIDKEEEDSFGANNVENAANGRKRILSKNRLGGGLRSDINLKKSESVNIFARESDPFDDDFFCGEDKGAGVGKTSPRNTELRWTEDFEN